MKILHVADTHLGYSAYRKATEDGINQRELDTYKAFEQFVTYAINTKPDLIIHAGDLFDSVRPNNRAITFGLEQINRLSKEKIPLVIIAGNHEHPKIKETGHIFKIFDHLDFVYPVYHSKYETIDFEINNEKITIHCIPQCELKTKFNEELKKLKPEKKADLNVFMAHGSVTGVKDFYMNEFNELIIPAKILSRSFDYIALGHFHRYSKLADNAFYAGSTERFTFTDAKDDKGFIQLNLKKDKLSHKFIKLENRQMIDSKPIKCKNLKLEEVMKKIKDTVKDIKPEKKTIRITLDNIPSHIYRGIDLGVIRKQCNQAIHFEIKANVLKDKDKQTETSSKINALTNEFKDFIDSQEISEKQTLLDLGISYIEKIQARDEGK